jgi:hypothetical protein
VSEVLPSQVHLESIQTWLISVTESSISSQETNELIGKLGPVDRPNLDPSISGKQKIKMFANSNQFALYSVRIEDNRFHVYIPYRNATPESLGHCRGIWVRSLFNVLFR